MALLALALPLLLATPRPAVAMELLSWWRRDLLTPNWEPGDWATYAQTEWTEDGVVADTVTVEVLPAASEDARWFEITSTAGRGADRLLIRPLALRDAMDALDAVDSLLRREGDGPWIAEDLDAYRDQRLVQRHLEDPFRDPEIVRHVLADTVVTGTKITRERVEMHEVQRSERSMGRSTLVLTTELHANAVISPEIPLAGILRAHSVSTVRSETIRDGSTRRRRDRPPLVTESTIECIAFGRTGSHPKSH